MDNSDDDLSELVYVDKLKTQTFKQFQLERLLKIGAVIPSSNLAEAKELGIQLVREFEAASEDQQRHNRTAVPPPRDRLENLPLTRKRFEE